MARVSFKKCLKAHRFVSHYCVFSRLLVLVGKLLDVGRLLNRSLSLLLLGSTSDDLSLTLVLLLGPPFFVFIVFRLSQ